MLHLVQFFLTVRHLAQEHELSAGAGERPHFSLRTLTRALTFARTTAVHYGFIRALYEGCFMMFCTMLDAPSTKRVEALLQFWILLGGDAVASKESATPAVQSVSVTLASNGSSTSTSTISFFSSLYTTGLTKAQLPKYLARDSFSKRKDDAWMSVYGFAVKRGPIEITEETEAAFARYILTPSVIRNLKNLARILATPYPILLQGPTSVGKTSMIEYLANLTHHRFVRVNNHEHTELQEYIGSYGWNEEKGKLVFQDGVLVQALRNGWWLVLDELNLAPSDVLEALNRLLDDNRELLVVETGELIHPHPDFRLFATQNPAGSVYGGRKHLSRAFRNRFIECFFCEIPCTEIEAILQQRCQLAPSYAKKLRTVYSDLQTRRSKGNLFAGKNGFMTLRDLFRWGSRDSAGGEQLLAEDGWMLIAERLRTSEERIVVKQVLEAHLRCDINPDTLYERAWESYQSLISEQTSLDARNSSRLVWTRPMKRLFHLIWRSIQHNEPVLLVGETGCGKTTVVQLCAALLNVKLHAVNCHQNSEVADFIGGMRPTRSEDPSTSVDATSSPQHRNQPPFRWYDGPLVQSMRNGEIFLLDEISLAEDAVLERLNSVLEPSRMLVLAEKGTAVGVEELRAASGFQFCATMNPGGDFGKKELSPALRNRFTEIWIGSPWETIDDLSLLVHTRLQDNFYVTPMLSFLQWLATHDATSDAVMAVELSNHLTSADVSSAQTTVAPNLSRMDLRHILLWIEFCNHFSEQHEADKGAHFIHGGCMTFVDCIEVSSSSSVSTEGVLMKEMRLQQLISSLNDATILFDDWKYLLNSTYSAPSIPSPPLSQQEFSLGPFQIPRGDGAMLNGADNAKKSYSHFSFSPQTTTFLNALKILRAMQLPNNQPILLEGPPGVGKSALVEALAQHSNHALVRINLSDQTDLCDLFGADLPLISTNSQEESVRGTKESENYRETKAFAWKDGPFLKAMKSGAWVLLDELNLASQSVLEGLNACLDHRGTVGFSCIPGVSFLPSFRRLFLNWEKRLHAPKTFVCLEHRIRLVKEGGGKDCQSLF